MKKIFFTISIFLCFTSFLFSQTSEDGLYLEYKKADKELNLAYNKLKSKLKSVDQTALVNAQKAWLKYRDLNCKFTSQEDSQGGVISNKMKIDCLTQSTIGRTKELKELFNDF
jgi:uncharacterized protein YecT (DUF1311 family)